MVIRIRIRADLEQRADEGNRAMVNRILQTRADRQRHRPVRHNIAVVDGRAQRIKIAGAKSLVDLLELLVFRAPIGV